MVFVCLTYSLLQIHLLRQGHEKLNRRTWQTSHRLLPDGDRAIIYRQQYFGFSTLLEHVELMLSLEGKARRRALSTTRRLLHESLPDPAQPDHTQPPHPGDRRLTSEPQLFPEQHRALRALAVY